MSTRTDLAAAASTVEGLTASPYFTGDVEKGTVYVRLERVDYPSHVEAVAFWNVVLMLPQDLAEAEQFLEAKLPALREALAEHMAVTSARPQRLEIPGVGVLPGVFVNGHREADDD